MTCPECGFSTSLPVVVVIRADGSTQWRTPSLKWVVHTIGGMICNSIRDRGITYRA